jgi:hypothetical protein
MRLGFGRKVDKRTGEKENYVTGYKQYSNKYHRLYLQYELYIHKYVQINTISSPRCKQHPTGAVLDSRSPFFHITNQSSFKNF